MCPRKQQPSQPQQNKGVLWDLRFCGGETVQKRCQISFIYFRLKSKSKILFGFSNHQYFEHETKLNRVRGYLVIEQTPRYARRA
jgi:hypothetical protein